MVIANGDQDVVRAAPPPVAAPRTRDIELTAFGADEGRRRYQGNVFVGGKPTQAVFTPCAGAGNNSALFRTVFPRATLMNRRVDP